MHFNLALQLCSGEPQHRLQLRYASISTNGWGKCFLTLPFSIKQIIVNVKYSRLLRSKQINPVRAERNSA